ERAGVETQVLDRSMEGFARRLGEARAGTGDLASFLKKSSPAFLEQLQAATSTEDAFLLMADAIKQVEDPTDRAALAAKAFGESGAGLINLLRGGRSGVRDLMLEFARRAGDQEA